MYNNDVMNMKFLNYEYVYLFLWYNKSMVCLNLVFNNMIVKLMKNYVEFYRSKKYKYRCIYFNYRFINLLTY